jgi:hypothetical protein
MHKKYENDQFFYDGSQMESLWAYKTYGLLGDSIIAFQGQCDVPLDHMIDQEDANVNAVIKSPLMLHFIIEHFGSTLEATVLRQRLLAAQIRTMVHKRMEFLPDYEVTRSGDDIYIWTPEAKRKLSISIATVSPVSTKIHFAMNIVNADKEAGLPTAALLDYIPDFKTTGVEPFARTIMDWYADEMCTVHEATCKVNWIS